MLVASVALTGGSSRNCPPPLVRFMSLLRIARQQSEDLLTKREYNDPPQRAFKCFSSTQNHKRPLHNYRKECSTFANAAPRLIIYPVLF